MNDPILILHGWGSLVSGQSRFGVVKELLEKKGYTVYAPDLPGFGDNVLKKEELYFADYISFVKEFLEKKKLSRVILMGHSFGGRIAIAFSARYPEKVAKLILAAPSGIPHPLPSLRKKVIYSFTKILRPIFDLPVVNDFYHSFRKLVYYALGEMDYYKAGKLAKTFKNVYQVSIVALLPKIKAKTLLIFGEKDMAIPVADGVYMHSEIKNSQLIVVPNATHKFPYEDPKNFVGHVLSFLK